MPRRNLFALITITLVALLCCQRVQKTPYGRVLAEAIGIIESRYLEPVESEKLFEKAMDGMIDQLDENSAYITPDDCKRFHQSIDLQFEGVGMEVAIEPETKQLIVLSPLPGSPAYKAGVLAGDKILRINDESTQGMSLRDAVGLLRGKPGTPVVLTVLHKGRPAPTEITIVRDKIQIDSVRGDTRNADGSWNYFLEGYDRIGYIRVSSFTDQTAGEMRRALEWLSAHRMRGLVIDLRDNPGGYLGAAIDVCDALLPSGVIVTIRRRDGQISRSFDASGRGRFTDFPVAVLINDKTASAAEIVAASLQDHHRAAVFGQRSYGKGTIQEIIDLEKGAGAMKITTASYWRPSGTNIHRPKDAGPEADWGVSPDHGHELTLDDQRQNLWRVWRARRDGYQLATAGGQSNGDEAPFIDQALVRAVEYVEKEAVDSE